jgi:hypothetical protein
MKAGIIGRIHGLTKVAKPAAKETNTVNADICPAAS